MINCVIVEDERLARQKLQLYVEKHNDLNLVVSYASAESFLKECFHTDYDLLLLDIGLPNIDGITLAGKLPKHCRVIFTTAYTEYAVEAFNINAIDYLLKPFNFERFSIAINKINIQLNQADIPIPVDDKIFIKEGKRIHRLSVEDIFYIKGLKEYVVWHTDHGKLITLHSLSYLIDYLDPFDFIQTHKSYIVNKLKVSALEYGFVHINNEQIPIGRSYREQVRQHFKVDL
ncbi:LytR/AlgR family response regulator transcription factor [Winogradskyella sp. R77965]|uniref:LytR/AlgR family response regulator transcription factor n=1 Tax=Winogradskyella sp. R77965 TaxID=3093872 RepID=UPI0037DCB010